MGVTLLDLLAQKARVAALVAGACAVTGVASAAALSPTTFSPVDSSTGVTATASPSVSPSDSPSAAPSDSASPVASDSAAPDATPTASPTDTPGATPSASASPCPSGLPNHGAYVSGVARDKSTSGRDHGKAVSEAAHSDCGKSGSGDASATPEASDSPDATDSPEASDAGGARPATRTSHSSHGHGHGKKH